jgi:hypothetical protein
MPRPVTSPAPAPRPWYEARPHEPHLAEPRGYPHILDLDRRYVRLYDDAFDAEAVQAMEAWRDVAHVEVPPGGPPLPPEYRLMFELLSRRVRMDTPEGRAAFDALRRAGPLAGPAGEALEYLVAKLGGEALRGHDTLYIGHATPSMLSLAPTVQALGGEAQSCALSTASGHPAALAGMWVQAEGSGGTFQRHYVHFDGLHECLANGERLERWEFWDPPTEREVAFIRKTYETATLDQILASPHDATLVEHMLSNAFWERGLGEDPDLGEGGALLSAMQAAVNAGRRLVVDKGGPAVAQLAGQLDGYLEAGLLRFVAHNTDDLKALARYLEDAYIIDLCSSRPKLQEARTIAQDYAAFASEEVEAWRGVPIEKVTAYVVGYGNLGKPITEELRSRYPGLPIVVIDKDPEKVQQARDDGFEARLPILGGRVLPVDGVEPQPRPERALAVIATDGVGLDEHNFDQFADDVLAMFVTSGGKGLGPRLHHRAIAQPAPGRRRVRADMFGHRCVDDLEYVLRSADDRLTRMTLIAAGQPLNLFKVARADRFAITSAAVAACFALAAGLKEPGVHSVPADIEDALLAIYAAFGCDQPHPPPRR